MNGSLTHYLLSDPVSALLNLAWFLFLVVVLDVLPACAVLYVFYFLLTLPLRRGERARLFLDLLEQGLRQGRTTEAAIIGAASSRDASLGARFHLLAAYLEEGRRLSEALKEVPRLLPTQIVAMLQAGERIGDVAKVLPACREFLKDGLSRVRAALNYAILVAVFVTPAYIVMPLVLHELVLPRLQEVFAGLLEGQWMPAFSRFVFAENGLMTAVQVAVFLLFWVAVLFYVSSPRLYGWVHRLAPRLSDWVLCRLPWRWKQLQRDFSAMLAVLLDAEVPEAEAVTLAAQTTTNAVLQRRAARACERLRAGEKLPAALRELDDAGELRWRLANALHRGGGFLRALTGWHEALAAKAFQLEQTNAQMVTTLLVLFSGALVASLVIAVFLVLIHLINLGVLW
jgi:type II secretory pathway component PulF